MNRTGPASLFNRNPELIRNLWLEISPVRLIAVPVVIALIMLTLYVNNSGNDITDWSNSLLLLLFIAGSLYWGSYQVNFSITQEFSQGTWDTQRLSGLTPLQMVIGKLLGAPCVAWYGSAILFAVYLVTSLLQTSNGIPVMVVLGQVAFTGINLALLALCSHALFLLVTLYGARNNRYTRNNRHTTRSGIILMLPVFIFMLIFNLPARKIWNRSSIEWFSCAIPSQLFILLTLLLLFASLFIGLLRLMRQEFNHKPLPFYLFVQALFWIVYCAGLTIFTTSLPLYLLTCLAALAVMAVIAALGARNDRLWWEKLFLTLTQHRTRDALTKFPTWLSLPGVWLIVALAALIHAYFSAEGYPPASLIAYLLGLLGFMLRDIFFILWVNLHPMKKNPFILALAVLIIAHVLLPILFSAMIDNGQYLWILPTINSGKSLESMLFVYSALVQCLIFAALLAVKIQPLWQNRGLALPGLTGAQRKMNRSIDTP